MKRPSIAIAQLKERVTPEENGICARNRERLRKLIEPAIGRC